MPNRNDYHLIPGLWSLSWYQLLQEIPEDQNKNWIAILNSRQLSVLLSLTNMILPWYWLWTVNKNDQSARLAVLDFKSQLERGLMAVLSVDDLIKTQLMLVAALTGEVIDRDHPENYMTGEYDPVGLHVDLGTINTTIGAGNTAQHTDLGTINTTIEAGNTAQHTDLGTINTTVGTIKTAVDTTNSRLSTINTTVGTTNTNLTNIKTSIDTGNTNQHADVTALIAKLEEIRAALAAADPDSLADELTAIAGQVTAVATILGV